MSDEVITVGVRELRDRLAHYLQLAREGTVVEITERGRAVAQLAPLPIDRIITEKLVAEGKMTVPEVELDLSTWEPLPATPGETTASEYLAMLREDER